MDTTDDTESMTAIVRRIVKTELTALEKRATERHFLSEEDADLLSKLALILQRVRSNDKPDAAPNAGAEALTNEQLMKRSA